MPDLPLLSAPTISLTRWTAVLAAAHSPAAHDATALYAIPIRHGINPAIALAFFKHESSCGTAGIARSTLNWGNLRRSRGHAVNVHDGWAWYFDWRASLEDWCILVHEYADKGLDTVQKLIPVYAPSSDGNAPARYIAFVVDCVKQWQENIPVPTPDTFHDDIRHWSSVAALVEHLSQHDPKIAPWAKGVTVHHTEVPLPSQWHGRASVESLVDFYVGKGWDGGPHLFVCVGAPNPADDGLWQMTPLNMPGIHAGQCNKDHWSIEVVGNYNKVVWPAPVADLVYGAAAALLNWRDLGPVINGHRECLPNKTCPGSAINLDVVRAELTQRMQSQHVTVPAGVAVTRWRCVAKPSLRVRTRAATDAPQNGSVMYGAVVTGVLVTGDVPEGASTNQWLKMGDGRFVWAGLLEQV